MTAPSIPAVLLGIQTRLKTISKLNTTSPARPGQIVPPSAVVGVPPIPDYHVTMRNGVFEINPTVMVLVSNTISDEAQLALAEYANPTGDKSIKAAIEGDKTLGGVVDQCFVQAFRPLGLEEVGVIGYWGGTFTLTVYAQGGS